MKEKKSREKRVKVGNEEEEVKKRRKGEERGLRNSSS